MDGFVPRQPSRTIGNSADSGSRITATPIETVPARRVTENVSETATRTSQKPGSLNELEQSLRAIDTDSGTEPPKYRRHFRLFPRGKRVKRIILIMVFLIVVFFGFLGVRALISSSKIFHGSLIDLVTPGLPLKTDAEGRTNVLVFGTSQDDTAHQDADGGGGLWLTDSIMLLSIDQKQHTSKMISIPRDLWVKIDEQCEVGYQMKINAVYECAADLVNSTTASPKNYTVADQKGAKALMDKISEVTGVTPQYFAHVNYSVLKQAVDAVGGIDVNVVGDGADGIYDTNFDWNCPKGPYTCKNVYYPHNGNYHLDGQQALYLARARADGGLYSYKSFGLAQGDFDRQMNQQKILTALKTKATSAGTLANPWAVSNLLDALGNNVTTNISTGELKTFIGVAKDLKTESMQSISLVKDGESVVTTGNIQGQSVVTAISGTLDYSSIIQYLAKKMSSNPAVGEEAKVAVLNASGVAGVAGNLQEKLSKDGITVDRAANAPEGLKGSGTYTIYNLSNGKMPATLTYLKSKLDGAKVETNVPAGVDDGTHNFVVVINQANESR